MTIKKLLCIFWQHGTGPWRLQNGNNAVNLKVAIASISLKKKKKIWLSKACNLESNRAFLLFFSFISYHMDVKKWKSVADTGRYDRPLKANALGSL